MALSANALTDLATVKQELNIVSSTDDAYITQLINVVSDWFQGQCARNFIYQAGIVENVRGYASTYLALARTPVVNLTSITYNGNSLASTDYALDQTSGMVYQKIGFYWTGSILPNVAGDPLPGSENPMLYLVTYDGGYVTGPQAAASSGTLTRSLPYDLEQAAVQGVLQIYKRRGQDRTIQNEGLGAYHVGYNMLMRDPFVDRIIRRYKRISMGY